MTAAGYQQALGMTLSRQEVRYAQFMAQTKRMTFRISPAQRAQLKRLADKLHVDQANVVRLAITRLAEQEGVALSPKKAS